MRFIRSIFVFLGIFLIFNTLSKAQELDWEKMLIQDVENINPVYMPVVGIGAGYINFLGDVTNNTSNPLLGSLAFKANMHAFIDQPKHYKFNLYVMLTIPGDNGTPLIVNQRDYKNPGKNFRFQTDLLLFGINGHYDFDHFIKKTSFIRPFVSVGAEFLTFSSKADLIGKYYDKGTGSFVEAPYNYWTDGTVRSRPQIDERPAELMYPDGVYETDLRNSDLNTIGKYNQYALAIPFEVGLDFYVSNRTSIRMSYSFHYTFTDNIDNVSKQNPIGAITNVGGSDNFSYTSVSLHFDLFSDPKMLRLNRLFLELGDYDFDLLGDEDGDEVRDIMDKCLNTPKGVSVDTLGCPFDDDLDGVPNFRDKELASAPGAIVDRDGTEIPDALVWTNLNQEALPRDQVEMYLELISSLSSGSGRKAGSMKIPEKFKALDTDGDGYISFDEVLKAIDSFFDFENELSTQDIYDLNDFFFAQ